MPEGETGLKRKANISIIPRWVPGPSADPWLNSGQDWRTSPSGELEASWGLVENQNSRYQRGHCPCNLVKLRRAWEVGRWILLLTLTGYLQTGLLGLFQPDITMGPWQSLSKILLYAFNRCADASTAYARCPVVKSKQTNQYVLPRSSHS